MVRLHHDQPFLNPRVAVALPVCAMWLPGALGFGGLAPIAVSAVCAGGTCLIGPVIARNLSPWRCSSVLTGILEIIVAGVVGAAVAPLTSHLGPFTAMTLGAGIWVGAVTVARMAVRDTALIMLILMSSLAGTVYAIAVHQPTFTLLEPYWFSWKNWLGTSILSGLFIGLCCTLGTNPDDRRSRATSWTGLGALLLVSLISSMVMAFEWEASAPTLSLFLFPLVGLFSAVSSATAAVRIADSPWMFWTGALFTGWFAGPGFATVPYWWVLFLPVLMALALILGSATSAGSRLLALAACFGLVGHQWPGLPPNAADAGLLGMAMVLMFWLLASRAALTRGEE